MHEYSTVHMCLCSLLSVLLTGNKLGLCCWFELPLQYVANSNISRCTKVSLEFMAPSDSTRKPRQKVNQTRWSRYNSLSLDKVCTCGVPMQVWTSQTLKTMTSMMWAPHMRSMKASKKRLSSAMSQAISSKALKRFLSWPPVRNVLTPCDW